MALRTLILTLVTGAALVAAPAVASAADTYVNGDGAGASDSNNCTVITTPCETIGQGLIQAGPGDTVHVDDAPTYAESQVLDDGKSLLAADIDNSNTGSHTIIGTGFPTISVLTGETGGTVTGFVLAPSAGFPTVVLNGPATFDNDTINSPNDDGIAVVIGVGGGASVIKNGSLYGDDSTSTKAIRVSDGSPQITNNSIGSLGNGWNIGILVNNGASPTISGNTIQATHQDDIGNAGVSIEVDDATATIKNNTINQPGTGAVYGIALQQGATPTGGTLSGNELVGNLNGIGIKVDVTTGPVLLESDMVTKFGSALSAAGGGGALATDGDVTANNVTFAGNTQDIQLQDTHLTMDSSIIEDAIGVSGGGFWDCTITFTRGPSILGAPCTTFQTTADPGFVNAGSGDYHLLSTSAMIDAGNPAAPAVGAVDVDGDARAIDADGSCPDDPVRDMGADEFAPDPLLDCIPPNTLKGKTKLNKRKRKVKITFKSSEPGSHFQCKLDRKKFKACHSPQRYSKLKGGKHTFQVRAIDAAGNTDPTPLKRKFKLPKRKSRH